jgi:hypothetical protein
MTEQELREILGFSAVAEVQFLGEAHKIREDGLAPLLRYARLAEEAGPDDSAPLAAVHRLLEDCVLDFPAFTAAALEGKAESGDIQGAVRQLVEFYCVRSHWAAMRLVGYIGAHLEETDGQLIRDTGRGLASLSAREACDLALAICVAGLSEEDRQIFFEDLNYAGNPEAEALAMVRQMQADRKAREAEAGPP